MNILLALITLFTTPSHNVPIPTEDDARVSAYLTLTHALLPTGYLVYEAGRDENGRRTVYAGTCTTNKCIGAYWTRETRDWTIIIDEVN